MDSNQWKRLGELFDRLLEGSDAAEVLASEPDPEIRTAVESLWKHHLCADDEAFLRDSLQFEVLPTFQPGQILANRFRIERMLGSGGMGEVYLAMDLRIEERIAIKTMARLLAPSPSIQRRILAEVQSARRVTHPNVCRIYDLFEEGATVFFSMEYVEGQLLSDCLADLWIRRHARQIALQMAEGLHAAHRTGVVHGDFKPANVIVAGKDAPRAVIMDFGLARALDSASYGAEGGLSVRAGTAEYMAPELHAGSPPTIRSDVFAFGKVAAQLLPGERIFEDCTRAAPQERPGSLEPVIRRLYPRSTRRVWLIGGAAAASALAYGLWPRGERAAAMPFGARVLVNGFSSGSDADGTRLVRSLLLSALVQSPRIRAVADQDLLPLLRRHGFGTLPLSGEPLRQLLALARAAYWIEGDLYRHGSRYSLNMQLFHASDQREVAASSVRDRPGVVDLAQQAALWLRTEAGESERALAVNPVTVGTYTSKVPEALQKYYDGMAHYAVAEMEQAIPLFEEAVRLDPNFAQAHHLLAMTMFPEFQYEESFRHIQIAKDLSGKLPGREKAWLLCDYYTLIEDAGQAVHWARANKDYFPDEPRCLHTLARLLCRTGDAAQSIVPSRESLNLAPDNDLGRQDLINNLCQAGQFEDALTEYQVVLGRGITDQRLHEGGGMAYLGLERYAEARAAFGNEPVSRDSRLDMERARVMQGDLADAVSAMRELRAGASNLVSAHRSNEFLCGLYFLTGRLEEANGVVEEMADLPPYPPMARRLDCTAFWAYRLGNGAALAKAHDRLAEIRHGWETDFTRTVERHAMALLSWRAQLAAQAEGQFLDASDRAFSPWRYFSAADFHTAIGRPERAEDFWTDWEKHRGMIVELWFPGALVMAWLGRAATWQALGRTRDAHRYSQKVLDHWSKKNPAIGIVQAAQNINRATRSE